MGEEKLLLNRPKGIWRKKLKHQHHNDHMTSQFCKCMVNFMVNLLSELIVISCKLNSITFL